MKSPKNTEKKDSSLKDGAKKENDDGIEIVDSDEIRPEVQESWDKNLPMPDLHGYITIGELALFQEYGE